MFFEEYFSKRGEDIQANAQNEVIVRCPFPHDKGLDTKASASFNTERRIYKCFTCAAEDRESGMSETSFIAKVYDTTYENANKFKRLLMDEAYTEQLTTNLLESSMKDYLNGRGITDEIIKEYKLGYKGDGIIYPVFVDGLLYDTRTYRPNSEPKIKSKKGAKALLFPYDQWIADERDTVLTAGENDTLIARKMGFNAVETTLGEGSVPHILLNKFRGKKVYIAYDCDDAGIKSANRIAFYLKDVGADVFIISLGLAGTKEDKDVSDYFNNHGKTTEDFQKLMNDAEPFTLQSYIEQKNTIFPLVDLWNVKHSRYSEQYISSRVTQMGHFELPIVDVPSVIEWECRGAVESNKVCDTCPFWIANKSGEWSLESKNLEDVLELVEVDKVKKEKAMKKLCGIPEKCPNSRLRTTSKKHVEKVILAPDVETESENTGYKQAELHAFILDGDTDDGNKYRMFFKRVPHPKDQSIILIVDKVEDSDNAINTFKVTDKFVESMNPWKGNPYTIMQKRLEELGRPAVGNYLPESIFSAFELTFHSVLDFTFLGQKIKGHPEGLVIGASRTGKSEVGNVMVMFYGMGNVTECKNASIAGLIGGVDKSSNGTFRISWGEIPRNHKGFLFLDEISGLPPEVFKNLTGLRSQRKAVIAKIRKGEAPAKTRLLWVGNPKVRDNGRSKSLYDYSNGVDICLDLFPADEDISRFDFIVLVPEPAEYISPLNDDGSVPEKAQLPAELKELIRWVWSRNSEQVKFDEYVEKYIEHVAIELNKDFGSSVKIVGIEATKKIARIAVSVAACCFSTTEDYESILVKKEHVDWTRDFLLRCYDNELFNLRTFVENERKLSVTNDKVNLIVAGLMKKYPAIIRLLLERDINQQYDLMAAGGLGNDEYRHLNSILYNEGLITYQGKGMSSTRRLRAAVAALQNKPVTPRDDSKPKSFSDRINLT